MERRMIYWVIVEEKRMWNAEKWRKQKQQNRERYFKIFVVQKTDFAIKFAQEVINFRNYPKAQLKLPTLSVCSFNYYD